MRALHAELAREERETGEVEDRDQLCDQSLACTIASIQPNELTTTQIYHTMFAALLMAGRPDRAGHSVRNPVRTW